MLTSTISRLVRGRIYHIKRVYYDKGFDYLAVFKGNTKTKGSQFLTIARKDHGLFEMRILNLDWLAYQRYTITEVPQEDLLLYVGYELKSDLYKELLENPSLNLKVKLKLKSRVAKALRGKGAPGRIQ